MTGCKYRQSKIRCERIKKEREMTKGHEDK